ncbi:MULTISPECIES: heavy metal-binding domain-containing protein [Niastella]|uniref:Heavy metal binding domain-containing protein n=1 Tax=Niastella soli TaxID=2821487 RepID=A0ABS3YP07_9BACT|nr:heavy metal-binding domain-containing protein [Niastella soli]MBO9199609.1 hypothetical protein [Niastella soli]
MKKILLLAMACLTMFVAFSQDKKSNMPKSKSDTGVVKTYTCPMHPNVLSNKPGKCPQCGMALIEKIMYVCPMHPEVVSDKPGKCPKCGMQLKIMSDTPKHKHTDSTHSKHSG